jgi:hypothetical protein
MVMTVVLSSAGETLVWVTAPLVADQPFSEGQYQFVTWTGNAPSAYFANVDLALFVSPDAACDAGTVLAVWQDQLLPREAATPHTSPFMDAGAAPAGSYVCWKLSVSGVSGPVTLLYDGVPAASQIVAPAHADGGASDGGRGDAGEADGGLPDGGRVDGGPADAGSPDGGDAGPRAQHHYGAGCGCQSAAPVLVAVLSAVALRRARRDLRATHARR